MEITFKPKFIEHYSKLTDFECFKESCLTPLRRAIRVNTLKTTVEYVKSRLSKNWELTPVPWCKEGFWIKNEERKDIGNLIEHTLGYIYIQEPASMIPPVVLDPKPGDIVMDLCASPGSKSTQIGAMLKGKGFLVANDFKGDRLAPLGLNLKRMGVINSMTTLSFGESLKGFSFDKILVDAPCSGTGTIRKSLKTLLMWNAQTIKRLANTQKKLIKSGYANLKAGGTMVYSTCSCEPFENEAVVSELLETTDAYLEPIELPIKRGKPFLEFDGVKFNPEVEKTLRIWPQDNDTEGFFVARIRKP